MFITPFSLAQRFVGTKEVDGHASNPQVLAMLRLDSDWPEGDEVAWCSAFVNYIAWLCRLPRSKSLAARSWLGVGQAVTLANAEVGSDIVVLNRSGGNLDPSVAGPGHVGFFASVDGTNVMLLAGNQGNSVSIASFPASRILGVRRLDP